PRRRPASRPPLIAREVRDIEALRDELERRVDGVASRWNANPEDVQRSVAKLVLTLVEFLRKLFERQALGRMEAKNATPDQPQAIGLALMRLEETIQDKATLFSLAPWDLKLSVSRPS